jgi:release factor glutamine methyltransferase
MESHTTITTETKSQRLRQALADGSRCLKRACIESARLDAEVLLAHALAMEKTELYLKLDARLTREEESGYQRLLQRRARREPVAYILGRKEFWSLDFFVTSDVLIPRPETERLVEVALEQAKLFEGDPELTILDLGTGSGAIAISLAREMPQARITAVDVSAAALEMARQNSVRHGVASRIDFLNGDFFDGVTGPFDLIVSNPPYVRWKELAALAPEVRDWEPLSALDAGRDGLSCYRRIIAAAHRYLVPKGQIILEMGADMGESVGDLFRAAGCYTPSRVYQDYGGRDRVIAAAKLPR